MPSATLTACIRQGDRDLLIPCCRYTGGPTTQRTIIELLDEFAPMYSIILGRGELILTGPRQGQAERIHKGYWLVVDGPIPHVYPPSEFELKYYPTHHSVNIFQVKQQE